MHVTCPACDAAYEVPDKMMTPARRLRCAQCGAEWHPRGPDATPPAVERLSPEPVAPVAMQATMPEISPAATALPEVAPPPEPPPLPPKPAPPKPAAKPPPLVERAVADVAPPPIAETIEPSERLIGPETERVRPSRSSGPLLWAAWAMTCVILAAGSWSAYTYRDRVMQVWPPSQRAYAAIGLSIPNR